MATQEERVAALETALTPHRTAASMTFEDRMVALERAAPAMVRSPEPRELETRIKDLEAFAAAA